MSRISISSPGMTWGHFSFMRMEAAGTVAPRLRLLVNMQLNTEVVEVELHHLSAALSFGDELLGVTSASGITMSRHGHDEPLEFPVTRELAQYVTSQITGDAIEFKLELSGWARVKFSGEAVVRTEPQAGEWGFVPLNRTAGPLHVRVSRSDWFSSVMTPIETIEYMHSEVALPRGSDRENIKAALGHIKEAERHYVLGDDSEVFHRLRGAVDALPGSPKNVFDDVPDAQKRKALDDLLLAAGNYLHGGRHVRREGQPEAGTFPVTHRDAELALALAKVVLAQTATALGSTS